ncbi:MAG: NMD3-related protein [Candidatus Helarchaeota archaeon]
MSKKFRRFCINCGESGLKKEDLINGLCFKCYRQKNPFITLKEQPVIHLCKECLAIKLKKEWIHTNISNFYQKANDLLNKNINIYFDTDSELTVSLKLNQFPDFKDLFKYNSIQFEVHISGKVLNHFKIDEILNFKSKIKIETCDNCKDIKSSVSKSKIRIIARKRKITEEEIDGIIQMIKNSANIYKDPNFYILPPLITPNELIFRVSSIEFAKIIANQLKKRFGGVLRESVKYIDREKTKSKKQDLNILVRLLPFFNGDVIKFNEQLLYVISIQDEIVNCFDFKSKEIKKYKTKQIIKGEKYLDKSKFKKYFINAIYKDIIQIMDLNTFQTFEIELTGVPHFINVKEGTEINGFKEGEKLYLIPFYQKEQDSKNE